MGVVLLRDRFQWAAVVSLCLLLAACGGGSAGDSVPDSTTGAKPPISPPPVVLPPSGQTPVEMGLMVAFGYNSLVAGAPFRTNQVQSLAVGNGNGTYRFPRSGETFSGNLTLAVDVADPDGIARVLVGFNGSESALVLCDANCGNSFSQTVTGINPRNFGLTPGSLRLELWLEDQLGNRILFDARDIEWLPQPVVGVNTSRNAGALQVNWTANSSASRYNLYIAEQPGITPDNILSKTAGRQFLALSQTNFSVPAVDATKRYFVLITGIDSAGESQFSEQHVVQPAGLPEFSFPLATPDQFSLNEDTEITGSLLSNDSHPDARSFRLDSTAVRPADNGTVVLNSDGSFVYTPVANFAGSDSFIYQIIDTQGLTAQALVSLTVLPVNDAPLALEDSYSLNKNTTLAVAAPGVLANDTDIDGDRLQVSSSAITAPAHGTLQLNEDGSFNYSPVANYTGEDFFVYRLTDSQGGNAEAKVTLRVEMTNAAPVARNDSYQLPEDEALVISSAAGVLSNDSDPDGDSLTLVTELIEPVQNGQLTLASDGSFRYIPRQDFFGTDSFSYQIADPAGLVSSATVLLTVSAQNDPPVVQASSYSVPQAALLSVASPGLLVHAVDVDDTSLSIETTAVVAPSKGTVTLSANGAFSYQPNANATGSDSFSYRVKDPAGAAATGTVVLSIVANANPPVLTDIAVDVSDNVAQGFVLTQLSVSNSNPDSAISFSILEGNTQGIFSLSASGALSIANPAPLFELGGTAVVLLVQAQDSIGLVAQAQIRISVLSTRVTAQNDSYSVPEDQILTSAVSVLANDIDSKGQGLSSTLVTAPTHGVVNLNANGHFTYTPNPNFFGQDSFVYSASNGIRSALATVVISVSAENDAPTLSASTFSFSEAATQGSVLGQLLWQDVDVGQSYSFSILSGDYSQAFTINSQGQLILANSSALLARQASSGNLQVRVTDSGGAAAEAIISLQLVSAQPTANADFYTVVQGSLLQVNAASAVLANDSNPLQTGLTVSLLSAPTHGQLTLNADGSFSYLSTSGFYGQDSFVYQISNTVRSAQANVVINVTQVQPTLLANFDGYTLDEDSTLTVLPANSVLQNDIFDPDQPVTLTLMQAPPYGVLTFNSDGTFIYQPASNSYGAFYFTYRITQGNLFSESLVELNIAPVNDAPNLQDATASVSEDAVNSESVVTMIWYDQDPGSYSYEIISGDPTGVFAITSGGTIEVANASLLNATTTPSYTLLVKVTENNDPAFTDTAVVVITVTQGMPALVANFDAYTFNESTTLTVISANSLLQNDVFNPDLPVTVSLVQAPPFGSLSLATDGTFVYQPNTGAYGSYYFSYRLTQGTLTSDAQVELNIVPVNDAPNLQDATATVSENAVSWLQVHTMTLYDSDPGSYSYQIFSGDGGGAFSINSAGVIQVANASLLDADITPSYTLVIKVTENGDPSLVDTATVVITVLPVASGTTNLTADANFAAGSSLSLQMMLSGEYNDPAQIIPLTDGRSLVIGTVGATGDEQAFVARLTADGSIDTSYADRGLFRQTILTDSIFERAVAAVLVSGDELVVLINYTDIGGSGFFLIKLDSDGNQIETFGSSEGYLLCAFTPCDSVDMKATDLIQNEQGHYVISGVKDGDKAFLFNFADSGYQDGWLSTGTIRQFDKVLQDNSDISGSNDNYYGIGQSSTNQIVVARFSSTLDLDVGSFGCEPTCIGYQVYNFSSSSSVAYDALLYNDALYVVGSMTATTTDGLFFKLNANGSLNYGFGGVNGFIQVTPVSGYALHYTSLAVDASGFYALTNSTNSGNSLVSISQYNLIGQFMQDQPVLVDGRLKAADLQSDGSRLWLLNQFSDVSYGAVGSTSFNWVGKYQQNTLNEDTAFSVDGYRWFNAGFSNDSLVGSSKLVLGAQADKTLFYGYSQSGKSAGYHQAFIGRLTSSGMLDPSFGNHGVVLLANNNLSSLNINTLIEHSAEQIYVAGDGLDSSSAVTGFVTRFNQDGLVDATFANGFFTMAPAAAGSYTGSEAVQLQLRTDGRLLVGAEYSQATGNVDVVLVQLNTDGSLDSANFGSAISGYTIFDEIDSASVTVERLSRMKLDPVDDSLVVVGESKPTADNKLFIARFDNSGYLMNDINRPADFFSPDGQGFRLINITDSSMGGINYQESIQALDFDTAGNLLLIFSRLHEGGQDVYLNRFQRDGSLDNTFNYGVPKLYNSLNDFTVERLTIDDIEVDVAGRLVMAGTYRYFGYTYAWVGRVLLDGADADVGRWDPEFESNFASYGVHILNDYAFPSNFVIRLSGSTVSLGWNELGSENSTLFRQYQMVEIPD